VSERGVETICVHGDTPGAVAFVGALRQALADRGFGLRPFLGTA
jgi:lactam utilization protein B